MRRLIGLWAIASLLLGFAGTSLAQTKKKLPADAAAPAAAAAASTNLDGLDDLVAKSMKEWKVPGLAIAVVRDGKVIFSKGYGQRDIEKNLPVTTGTLFPIGSISKSFTALTFAILNDEGKVDWDKPVRDYLPDFQLNDAVASERATPRDLFSHRTGLPRHDLVWYSSDFSRADMFSRLRYLKPSKDFRSAFQYNNLMFMTMGYLEGKITGLGWEGAIKEKIFAPLGMTHSDLSVTDIEKTDDHALPYELKKEVLTKVPYHNIDGIGPAGSINSSADDMSRYLIFNLGDGKFEGKQIVSESNLRMMHSPQTAVPEPPPTLQLPGLGRAAYGLAWVSTGYRGHNLAWHNGGIDGFYALLSLLPDDHMGVVILTNQPNNQIPELLAYSIYDRLLGLDRMPWFDRMKDLRDKFKQQQEKEKAGKASDQKKGTHISHDLKDYAGAFENPGYGTIRIEQKDEALQVAMNRLGPYPLVHYHYDIFQIPEDSDSPAAGTKLQFEMNTQGDIQMISAKLEQALNEDIVFIRAAGKVSLDTLKTLLGDYLLGEMTATVSLAGDTLRLSVPGQPQYELVPYKDLTFQVKGLDGFSVEFTKNAAGQIFEAIFHQPNGTFPAKRK